MIIYKITNKKNGKVYIGKHCGETEHRWKTHLKNALDISRPEHLYRAMRAHGVENFTYKVLETHPMDVGDDFLNDREKFFINKYKSLSNQNGYNMTIGGEGVTAAYCSTKTREKQSDSQDRFDYAAYNCSSGNLFKVFKKRSDIQKELPQVTHVRHVNHACNANDPNHTGKKYSNGVAYGFMWLKLNNSSTFPNKIPILPGCNKKSRTVKKIKKTDEEIAQYTLSGNLIKTYPNVVTRVANELNTQYSLITNAINGKSSSHMGFIWKRYPRGTSPKKITGLQDSKIVTFTISQLKNLPLTQFLNGKEVKKYNSALEALLISDLKPTELFKSLNDGTVDNNGFTWKWV